MAPGVITLEGFLGSDKRNLIDILIEDNADVERLGYDHPDIAARMEELRNKGEKGLGEFISVDEIFEVKVESVRGKLPSPFGGPVLIPKVNTTVHNKELKREIVYSDLHIHMIKFHGFYEGRGCQFRLEPQDLVDILFFEKD